MKLEELVILLVLSCYSQCSREYETLVPTIVINIGCAQRGGRKCGGFHVRIEVRRIIDGVVERMREIAKPPVGLLDGDRRPYGGVVWLPPNLFILLFFWKKKCISLLDYYSIVNISKISKFVNVTKASKKKNDLK